MRKKQSPPFVRALLAVALATCLLPHTVQARAADHSSEDDFVDSVAESVDEGYARYLETGNASSLTDASQFSFEDGQASSLADEQFPSSLDLREKGVVTPVKFQNPWGTCWAFAAVAASETSILSEAGLTYAETGLDLSERHVAWFANTALPEDGSSQAGEGVHDLLGSGSERMEIGLTAFSAASAFATGMGPIYEETAPYRNEEGSVVTTSAGVPVYYSPDGDWSLDESMRFYQDFLLEEASQLPSPAQTADDGSYLYDEDATRAIKSELMAGRGVEIAYTADTSRPGSPSSEQYINMDTWAHYTYEQATSTHGVTIVGWDDEYSKENFNAGHQPPEDGAWIVKNSWGSSSEDFPNCNPSGWGIDGGGYFYISYYDQSLAAPTSFNYDLEESGRGYYMNAYDFSPTMTLVSNESFDTRKMANVFEADASQIVRSVSVNTVVPGTTVTFDVYVLDDDGANPEDGKLVASVTKQFEYGGFHSVDLPESVLVEKGRKFSVVATAVTPSGLYSVVLNSSPNEASTDFAISQGASPQYYVKSVVNEGESYLFDKGWTDWTKVIPDVKASSQYGEYMDFDNFSIKAYSEPLSSFSDVSFDDWYFWSVDYVSSIGCMQGYAGTDLFGPNDAMERQDLACMLFKWLAPEEAAEWSDEQAWSTSVNETGLPDVEDGAYYTPAVNWAWKNGYLSGYENGLFGVGDPVTREAFATVVWRTKGEASSGVSLNAFPDVASISDWALPALCWCVETGVVSGSDDGFLHPGAAATRAEVAAMVMQADSL